MIMEDSSLQMKFMDYYSKHGIQRQFSIAKTPQQNGVVERKNMTVQEMA
jgi:transposase InsO family protein